MNSVRVGEDKDEGEEVIVVTEVVAVAVVVPKEVDEDRSMAASNGFTS